MYCLITGCGHNRTQGAFRNVANCWRDYQICACCAENLRALDSENGLRTILPEESYHRPMRCENLLRREKMTKNLKREKIKKGKKVRGSEFDLLKKLQT